MHILIFENHVPQFIRLKCKFILEWSIHLLSLILNLAIQGSNPDNISDILKVQRNEPSNSVVKKSYLQAWYITN